MQPNSTDNTYFDEAYFERGWERGTAYVDYKVGAASSLIFKDVARALNKIFQPSKCLEIGCATGAIVREFNALGVRCYGIDVSKWAVENSLHPNVLLASADTLPFSQGEFDLVYSSHSMEHLPDHIYENTFKEIDRVCGPNAVQFHMLPIIGTYPYNYDPDTAIADLKKDPTHSLLKTKDWWAGQWNALGWEMLPTSILMRTDTDNVELSSGQFCLVRKGSDFLASSLKSINEWNAQTYRELYVASHVGTNSRKDVIQISSVTGAKPCAIGPHESRWDDFKRDFAAPLDFEAAKISGVIDLQCSATRMMRIALLTVGGAVFEKWLELQPGLSVLGVDVDQFTLLSGDGGVSDVRSLYLGGVIEDFSITAQLSVAGPKVGIADIFV